MEDLVLNALFLAPLLIAVGVGLFVYSWLRRRSQPFHKPIRLRVTSACVSGLVMAIVGSLPVAYLRIRHARSQDTSDTGMVFGILAMTADVLVSIVLAIIVGTGIFRSAAPLRRSDEDVY